jgi:acetylornithine deacetylase
LSSTDSVLKWIDRNRDSIIKVTQDVVGFNTSTPDPGAPAHNEKDCATYLARALSDLGFRVDQWEPDTKELRGLPSYMPGQNFRDRPITVGVLKGKGGGKSLLINAHMDAVPAEPVDKWQHNPWKGEVVGDKLYGRGASDMKAGATVILKAMEALKEANKSLKGDVVVEFVWDEELNGMGTAACCQRGYKADAALIPEPSHFRIILARRGLLYGTLTVPGRSGHAEANHPHRLEGGAVNAIEKAMLLINALKQLETDWQNRPDKKHKYLSNPKIVPTMIKGGQFTCTYPETCEVVFDAQYIKANADKFGWGSLVKKEIEDQIEYASQCDPWLRANKPSLKLLQAFPPSEVDESEPIVETVKTCSQEAVGITPTFMGNDSNDDSSYIMTLTGTPSICYGPGPWETAHTIDEYVSIDSIVKTTKVYALSIQRWCGIA